MGEKEKSLAGADEYIARALVDWRAAGVAVAVVCGSEVIYAQGVGLREVGQAARIDCDTLFQVGSTTKAFTTAALGILADEGKLQWDDPVVEHLPWFRVEDPWVTRALTIRDTVIHRSGITGDFYFALHVMNSDGAVRRLRHARAEEAFRHCYLYSNSMYGVAGKVIEAASGSTWGEFLKERLLQPLGMDRSGTSPYEFWDSRYVATAFFGSAPDKSYGIEQARDRNVGMPHGRDEQGAVVVLPWQSYDSAAAAGSVVSTAADMAKWLILNVNEGSFSGRAILKSETIRELHAPQNAYFAQCAGSDSNLFQFPLTAGSLSYAMGWFRGMYRDQLHLSHSGGMLGFPAYAAFLPERKIGVVVLANGPQPARDEYALNKAIGFWMVDRLLGEPLRDWSAEFLARSHAMRRPAQREEEELQRSRMSDSLPCAPLAAYSGVYEDHVADSGPVNVALESGRLRLCFPGAGAFSAWLEPWHRDLFRMHASAEVDSVLDSGGLERRFVEFAFDAWGKVSSMRAFGALFARAQSGRAQ